MKSTSNFANPTSGYDSAFEALDSNPIQSSNDTVLMAGSKAAITDASGNEWTITRNGHVMYDGTPISKMSHVSEIAYVAGVVWEDARTGWYSIVDTGGKFSTGEGPFADLPLPGTVAPSPTITNTSPTPSVNLTTATGEYVTIGGATVGTVTVGNDTFLMAGNGAATATLGSPGETLQFVGMSQLTVIGASASGAADVISADTGTNTFIAGSGAMEVTGGSGTDTYVFAAGSGPLTIDDFSVANADKLILGANLQASMNTATDGNGGTLLTFSGAGSIDLKGISSVPTSSIGYVAIDPAGRVP